MLVSDDAADEVNAGREKLAGEEAEVVVEVVVLAAQAEDKQPLFGIRLAGGTGGPEEIITSH
jgi:hypothetical protein|uniref:hypothetical protein n=1 Tax=Prosthecobacter sp. TaxID=1965333 RepID=UPI00378423F0